MHTPGTPEPLGPASSTDPVLNLGPDNSPPPTQDGNGQSSASSAGAAPGPATAFRHPEPGWALPAPAPLSSPPSPDPLPAVLPPVAAPAQRERGLGSLLFSIVGLATVVLLTLYALPYVLVHWRTVEAHSEAETAYLKRQAELKAESEAAEHMLKDLDKRIGLVSLGFREAVRKVAPIVVNVANYRQAGDKTVKSGKKSTFLHDPDSNRDYLQISVGSGLIVKAGLVLTNYHVVKDAERLRVSFASGRSVSERSAAVAADPLTDLAVIRLSGKIAEGEGHAEFADSDKDVHAGDWALAIGSPLGLKQTVTQGVISAKGRLLHIPSGDFPTRPNDQFLIELLQTDAAINPGNSGGPLFDQLGRVVGINVAIASETGRNHGIGFAIPSNQARKIFEQLVEQGEVPRGFLGIALEELAEPKALALGLADAGGVHVAQVVPGQAAEKAGLLAGDVILRFRNRVFDKTQAVSQLRHWILETEPGSQVAMEIIRAGRHHTVNVQVGKRPAPGT